MSSPRRGSRLNRFVIRFFTVILVALVFWFLDFIVRDIRAMPGPDYQETIRRGPMRFATWSRKTVKNLAVGSAAEEDQPYVCPSCGTGLFEECSACHQVRPALLPHCDHCGTETEA